MFKQAIRTAMKSQGRTGRWLSQKTGIPLGTIWQSLGENRPQMSAKRIEKCFLALGIKVVVPEE